MDAVVMPPPSHSGSYYGLASRSKSMSCPTVRGMGQYFLSAGYAFGGLVTGATISICTLAIENYRKSFCQYLCRAKRTEETRMIRIAWPSLQLI